MQNKLGEVIYSIPELAADPVIMRYIAKSLRNLFEYLGFRDSQLSVILQQTLSSFEDKALKSNSRQRGEDIEYDLSDRLLEFYDKIGFREKRKKRVQGRAEAMFGLITPYLAEGETVLDVGTGNCSIALGLHNADYIVHAMDITDNRSAEAKKKEAEGLKFTPHRADELLRYPSGSYDSVLAIATLHHCDDPIRLLNELAKVSRKRLIIYESTFGISKDDMSPEVTAANPQLYADYFGLTREQQKMYGTFLDWFLNKIEFRNDAHVPCNFTSPDRWEEIFRERGLSVQAKKILGFDNPGISEFHISYVLEK